MVENPSQDGDVEAVSGGQSVEGEFTGQSFTNLKGSIGGVITHQDIEILTYPTSLETLMERPQIRYALHFKAQDLPLIPIPLEHVLVLHNGTGHGEHWASGVDFAQFQIFEVLGPKSVPKREVVNVP